MGKSWLPSSLAYKGHFSLAGEFLPTRHHLHLPDSLVSRPVSISRLTGLRLCDRRGSYSPLFLELPGDQLHPNWGTTNIEHGVGSFGLCLFVHPSSSTWVSFSLLIFLEAFNELRDHALYSNPKLPGQHLADGKFPLFPSSTLFKLSGAPHTPPLIIPGAPFDSRPSHPPNSVLLAAISSILRGWANPY